MGQVNQSNSGVDFESENHEKVETTNERETHELSSNEENFRNFVEEQQGEKCLDKQTSKPTRTKKKPVRFRISLSSPVKKNKRIRK